MASDFFNKLWDPGQIFTGNRNNPADQAMPYLQKAGEYEKQAFDPYIEKGLRAYDVSGKVLNENVRDPAAAMQKLMANYEQSPGLKQQIEESLRAARGTAAAGGYRGGKTDIQNQADIANSLSGQDMQDWIQKTSGMQKVGLNNLQNLYSSGQGSSTNLASDLANIFGTQQGLEIQGKREVKQLRTDRLGGGIGAVGGVIGGIYGGPAGAMAGYNAGSGVGQGIGGYFY